MDIIREDFLHFLWQNLHFAQEGLRTTGGEEVRIIHPGYRNEGDGADYRLSRIRLGGILFCGDVELHKASSEWYRHGHHRDSRYERVILHVVIHDDLGRRNVPASDGTRIPTLELHSSLPASLNSLWRTWHRPIDLACSDLVTDIPMGRFHAILKEWDRNYFRHRLDRMLALYPSEMPISAAWQQMLVRGVFQGLGYHRNQESMVKLADIFLSTSGYTELTDATSRDATLTQDGKLQPELIRQTGSYLLEKAGLHSPDESILKRTDWDFSGSRPSNQPTVRIPQAAELALRITRHPAADWLRMPSDVLWQNACKLEHYPIPGKDRSDTIFQNVIIPSVWLLGNWAHAKTICSQAMRFWKKQHIPIPHKVRKIFENGGFLPGKHLNRLSTLHQFKYHCSEKRCHECSIMKYLVQA